MPSWVISAEDPTTPDLSALVERHLAFARATTPPEDIYAFGVEALREPAVSFFALREAGEPLAMGALKRLDGQHAELKSMHTSAEARGRGLGRAMLGHLLTVARDRGYARVSLETGATPPFEPARSLYASAGFRPCDPFGSYPGSPNSFFMTLVLQGETAAP